MLKRNIALGILSLTIACGFAQTELGPEQIDAPVACSECTGHSGKCSDGEDHQCSKAAGHECSKGAGHQCAKGADSECANACGQEDLESLAIPSEETNTVEVSSTARRMRQLEKAKNLEENDSFGGSLTLIAMCIVISALILLSLLFMGFGKISQYFIKKGKERHAAERGKEINTADNDIASGETIAAIAMALAEHFGQGHDIEDTILTIHQIKKAYSPWNSKIYNLRMQPELHRNIRK